MNISFKLNGQDYNRPDNQIHINIQNGFRERLKTILAPIYEQMSNEVGGIIINYDDNGKLIQMTWGGYSIDSNAKMNILLKEANL